MAQIAPVYGSRVKVTFECFRHASAYISEYNYWNDVTSWIVGFVHFVRSASVSRHKLYMQSYVPLSHFVFSRTLFTKRESLYLWYNNVRLPLECIEPRILLGINSLSLIHTRSSRPLCLYLVGSCCLSFAKKIHIIYERHWLMHKFSYEYAKDSILFVLW